MVSPSGVVTAVGTGSTSITISNGKATAMVTVIVNRSADASSGSDNSNADTNPPDDNTSIPLDPVVQTIQDSTEDQVVFNQSEVPIVTTPEGLTVAMLLLPDLKVKDWDALAGVALAVMVRVAPGLSTM